MFERITRLFKEKAAKPVITTEMVRRANERLMAGEHSAWPVGIPKPTREDIENAGRKAMQAHHAREAAENAARGGTWWECDPIFQKNIKALRGEPHLTLVKKPDEPANP